MDYRRVGRSGLKVSALTLGVANFGSRWGTHWTLEKAEAGRLLDMALEAGINAFDTANIYNNSESEDWLGELLVARGERSRVILSTKAGFRSNSKDPNSGGAGRINLMKAVDASLKRLRTDYIDLFYLHLWDCQTPLEETLDTLDLLVAAGKLLYFGFSNVPSWYVARAEMRNHLLGKSPPIAVQLNYNILSRHIEVDYLDHVADLAGVGVIAWGALANGLVSGRYTVNLDDQTIVGHGRINDAAFTTGTEDPYQAHVPATLNALQHLARETGHSMSQLALAWLLRKNLSSVVLGVSSEVQLCENLGAARIRLDDTALALLDAAGLPTTNYPHTFLQDDIQTLVHGPLGATLQFEDI